MSNHALITFTRRSLQAATMLGLLAASSHAAIITWEAPHNITGSADVSTTGTLIGAVNLGSAGVASTTVNTVLFQALPILARPNPPGGFDDVVTLGDFTLTASTSSGFLQVANGFYGSASSPFNTLPSDYQNLLSSAANIEQPNTFTLTMNNLNIGYSYQFEWWANLSGPLGQLHSATATNTVSLNDNVSNLEGGLGQYGIGTFTANAGSQTVTFSAVGPANGAIANGFQLRQTAVPEPGTGLLLGIGSCFSGLFLRSRRSAARK